MADLIERDAALWITAETGALETQRRIKELPAANRWIPVSERLPEKQCRCLVTSESGKISIQTFLFSLTYGVEPYFSGCEKVIAWMPMPDAY